MNRCVRGDLALRSRGLHFLTSELEDAAVASSSVFVLLLSSVFAVSTKQCTLLGSLEDDVCLQYIMRDLEREAQALLLHLGIPRQSREVGVIVRFRKVLGVATVL